MKVNLNKWNVSPDFQDEKEVFVDRMTFQKTIPKFLDNIKQYRKARLKTGFRMPKTLLRFRIFGTCLQTLKTDKNSLTIE